jgi:proteasome accessory factor C
VSGKGSTSAEAVLQRLLLALPLAASRPDGVEIGELASALGVEPRQLLRDLAEVEERSLYLPAGMGDQIQLELTRDRLGVWTTGEFRRPVRLSPREVLALDLSLRIASRAAGPGEGTELDTLRDTLLAALRSPSPEEGRDPEVALAEADGDPGDIRVRVEEALRRGREIQATYRVPGRAPEPRRLGPILLAHAEGRWYLVARDLERDRYPERGSAPEEAPAPGQDPAIRAFRLDRMLVALEGSGDYRPSRDELDRAQAFLGDGRVLDPGVAQPGADAPGESALVEYSPRIAPWIRERGWTVEEEGPGGALRVRHRVLDPEWIVRHVLSYGGEAVLVEPAHLRRRIRERARGMTVAPGDPLPDGPPPG